MLAASLKATVAVTGTATSLSLCGEERRLLDHKFATDLAYSTSAAIVVAATTGRAAPQDEVLRMPAIFLLFRLEAALRGRRARARGVRLALVVTRERRHVLGATSSSTLALASVAAGACAPGSPRARLADRTGCRARLQPGKSPAKVVPTCSSSSSRWPGQPTAIGPRRRSRAADAARRN